MTATKSHRAGRAWAYVGALLGLGVSIAANIAHSYVPPAGAPDGWGPQAGAVWLSVFWPVAVIIGIEMLARTQWSGEGGWSWERVAKLGLVPVAAVAAVVSYRHLSGLLDFYGEDYLTVTLGPLAVDGLMIMASGVLLSTGRRAAVQDQTVQLDTEARPAPVQFAVSEPVQPAVLDTPVPHLPPPADRPVDTRLADHPVDDCWPVPGQIELDILPARQVVEQVRETDDLLRRMAAESSARTQPPPTAPGAPAPAARSAKSQAALEAAQDHHRVHGEWPSTRELEATAGVSRGTAGAVLKALREERPGLRLVGPDGPAAS